MVQAERYHGAVANTFHGASNVTRRSTVHRTTNGLSDLHPRSFCWSGFRCKIYASGNSVELSYLILRRFPMRHKLCNGNRSNTYIATALGTSSRGNVRCPIYNNFVLQLRLNVACTEVLSQTLPMLDLASRSGAALHLPQGDD